MAAGNKKQFVLYKWFGDDWWTRSSKMAARFGISLPLFTGTIGAIFAIFLFFSFPERAGDLFSRMFAFLVLSSPLWLPVMLAVLFWRTWVNYVRMHFQFNTEHVVLEIRLPQEITQTPLAMEVVLDALFQTGEEETPIFKYWHGQTRPWFSLEIASHEGEVHFYIWTRKKFQKLVEAQIYAHYPTVEVHEVPDYASLVRYDPETMNLLGIFQDKAPSRKKVMPFKTYLSSAFNVTPGNDEEEKTDPLMSVIEFLGSLEKGEYLWVQIIIRSHIKDQPIKGSIFFRKEGMLEYAQRVIFDEYLVKTAEVDPATGNLIKGPDGKPRVQYNRMPDYDKDDVKDIIRNIYKETFDTGIRVIYMAKNEYYQRVRHSAIPTSFRAFEAFHQGGLVPDVTLLSPTYPWQFFKKWQKKQLRKEFYEGYRLRSYFHAPIKRPHWWASSEEIATLYHFPGQVARTPTLPRIPSKKGEAPSNIPR